MARSFARILLRFIGFVFAPVKVVAAAVNVVHGFAAAVAAEAEAAAAAVAADAEAARNSVAAEADAARLAEEMKAAEEAVAAKAAEEEAVNCVAAAVAPDGTTFITERNPSRALNQESCDMSTYAGTSKNWPVLRGGDAAGAASRAVARPGPERSLRPRHAADREKLSLSSPAASSTAEVGLGLSPAINDLGLSSGSPKASRWGA